MNCESAAALGKQPSILFEAWKLLLRKDCEEQGKLVAFDAFGDYVLTILWQSGVDPRVQAIIDNGAANDTLTQ